MTTTEQSQQPKIQEHTNIKLIYDYVEYHFKLVNNSINILTTKLNVILGLSTILVFSLAVPVLADINTKAQYYWFLGSESAVGSLLIATLYICVTGFQPRAAGGMTPPKLLMDENYYDTDKNCRLIIAKTSIEALGELEYMRNWKAKIVGRAIWLFFCTITCQIISWIGCVVFSNVN